jgi:hypothetical protein
VYRFDPILFHNPDQEFDIDDAEAKLFASMKFPHAIDGCKLVRRLGWEFLFLVPISRTPIGGGIPIPFTIPKIPVGFFF